jgi:hypothetical protein
VHQNSNPFQKEQGGHPKETSPVVLMIHPEIYAKTSEMKFDFTIQSIGEDDGEELTCELQVRFPETHD